MTTDTKLACILVGLPARGKTFISFKVSRYLQWLGIQTKIFDEIEYFEKITGSNSSQELLNIQKEEKDHLSTTYQTINNVLNDLIKWLNNEENDGQTKTTTTTNIKLNNRVAIYDGSNITKYKRRYLYDKLKSKDIQVLFIESLCDDEELIRNNIRDVKILSSTKNTIGEEEAIQQYMNDLKLKYNHIYQTIGNKKKNDEEDQLYTYMKLINAGNQYIINLVHGYLESRVVYYLMNLSIKKKHIWLSRHGESKFNVEDKIGGNADLSPRGQIYAKKLPGLINKHVKHDLPLTVWTSTLKRTIQTANDLPYPKKQWKALDELDTGVCDGMTYDEIAEKYPDDFLKRDDDKFNYRYRGGESYRDLVLRLEPVIMEIEQHERILIIAHQATIRCLYAYFMNLNPEQLPYSKIPLHTLIELTPTAYHCDVNFYKANIDAVDTYRPKSAGVENVLNVPTKNLGASGEIANSNGVL